MTDRRPKHECPICKAQVRLIGKHMNQKHPTPMTTDDARAALDLGAFLHRKGVGCDGHDGYGTADAVNMHRDDAYDILSHLNLYPVPADAVPVDAERLAVEMAKAYHDAFLHYKPWPDSLSPCPDWERHLAVFEVAVPVALAALAPAPSEP